MLTSAAELRHALAQDELELRYQPIFDTTHKVASRVEAIICWNHPGEGLLELRDLTTVTSGDLGGAMVKDALTRFTVAAAIDQACQWHDAGSSIPLSVNVPATALSQPWLPRYVDELLTRAQLPASAFTIEIGAGPLDLTWRSTVRALANVGVRVSLDDFGGGDANLRRLLALPVDEIKLDQTFTRTAEESAVDRNIVAFCVHLASSLEIEVVATGVDSEAGRDELRRLGVHLLEGDHLHPAAPADDVPVLFPIASVIDLTDAPISVVDALIGDRLTR